MSKQVVHMEMIVVVVNLVEILWMGTANIWQAK